MVHLYIVDLLSKNGDFPVRYVGLPESKKIGWDCFNLTCYTCVVRREFYQSPFLRLIMLRTYKRTPMVIREWDCSWHWANLSHRISNITLVIAMKWVLLCKARVHCFEEILRYHKPKSITVHKNTSSTLAILHYKSESPFLPRAIHWIVLKMVTFRNLSPQRVFDGVWTLWMKTDPKHS